MADGTVCGSVSSSVNQHDNVPGALLLWQREILQSSRNCVHRHL